MGNYYLNIVEINVTENGKLIIFNKINIMLKIIKSLVQYEFICHFNNSAVEIQTLKNEL